MISSKGRLNGLFDVVVIGSGPAGVSAAHPLVKAGLNVAMVDAGLDSKKKAKLSKDYNISKQYTSPAYDLIKKSSYVFNKTYQLLEIQSQLEIIQSLAKGGLSELWSGICDYYSAEELKTIGLPVGEIQREYREVTSRIKYKTRTNLDFHSKLILEHSKNSVYQPLVITYNSKSGVDDLMQYKNFTYIPNQLVSIINDKKINVEVQSFDIDTNQPFVVLAQFVVLAAGSINTTRILQRSLALFDYKTTFLTKAHYLTACLHARTLIKRFKQNVLHKGQVVMSSQKHYKGLETFFIQFYRYNPQMVHKALAYIPLPRSIAQPLLTTIVHSVVVADIRFPAFEFTKKFSMLKKNGGNKNDLLKISFEESKKEIKSHQDEYKNIKQQLQSLGLFPLKTVPSYATAHYAGGVPFQSKTRKLSVDINGRLHQGKRIYVADSSTWRALPAKPPTFTIMANASRIGKQVMRNFH